jgi:hypothetical protein
MSDDQLPDLVNDNKDGTSESPLRPAVLAGWQVSFVKRFVTMPWLTITQTSSRMRRRLTG